MQKYPYLFLFLTLLLNPLKVHSKDCIYNCLTLLARAGSGPYRLPFDSLLRNTSPQINDDSLIIYPYWGWDDRDLTTRQRIRLNSPEESFDLWQDLEDRRLSGPVIDQDHFYFALSEIHSFQGLWKKKLDLGAHKELLISPEDLPHIRYIRHIQVSDQQDLSLIAQDHSSNHSLYFKPAHLPLERILREGDTLHNFHIKYLSTHSHQGPYITFIARGKNQSKLIRWHKQNNQLQIIAKTGEKSIFRTFSNQVSINQNGDITVIASDQKGEAMLMLFPLDQEALILAKSSKDEITFESFSPSINNAQEIVIRARDINEKRGIIKVSPGSKLKWIIKEGELVPQENGGTAQVLHDRFRPGLAGHPQINNKGEVTFSVTLQEKDNGPIKGSALFIWKPQEH